MMIAVVDYHKGNLKSVERGLMAAGGDAVITDDAASIARADAIVLPGVGSFYDAATTMVDLGQMDVVRERILAGVPFLGICLGLHLMFEEGAEVAFGVQGSDVPDAAEDASNTAESESNTAESVGNIAGMGVLPGTVTRIPQYDEEGRFYKVPHVGWNTITNDSATFDCPLLEGIPCGEYFYFTHSYMVPDGSFVVARTQHSVLFPSVVACGDVAFGVQFHPEKSSDAGLVVLRNFVEIAKGA